MLLVPAGKPIGAIRISPATLTRALADHAPKVIIGNDQATVKAMEATGGKHITCRVDDIIVDQQNRIVTTPAYILGPGIKDVAIGIDKLVDQVMSMIG